MPDIRGDPRGSVWRRWDPHLHAPGTLLNDGFVSERDRETAWDSYLRRIEAADPVVSVLGITDYFGIRTYKDALAHKVDGRMADVDLLFPNVELRLDVGTHQGRPINLHLMFSPADVDHVAQIERVLARLEFEYRDRKWTCCESDLIALGRLNDPAQTDEGAALSGGANQFKVQLSQIKDLFREDGWVRKNCLVAVAGGTNDGTSGLQQESSYTMTRQEIERFADIIFAATPSQREFWLGEKPEHGRDVIEATYRSLKPCLHGSDAHTLADTLAPDLDRFCWIKGDPTFETLIQAVLEPDERVWIGATPPPQRVPQSAMRHVRTAGASWIEPSEIPINPGLVAVIGARGSGKTALVEIIAKGASAEGTGEGHASFLSRAKPLLGDSTVEIDWSEAGEAGVIEPLAPSDAWEAPVEQGQVRYLSQQFVDRLCSETGPADELRAEIERVIFDATDPVDRLETNSFGELTDVLLEPVRRRRDELRQAIAGQTQQIVAEELLETKLPQLKKDRDDHLKGIRGAEATLVTLLPKGSEERTKVLAGLEQAHAAVQARIEGLNRRLQALEELRRDVEQVRTLGEPARLSAMRARHAAAALPAESWGAFSMEFSGDVDRVIADAKNAVERELSLATTGDTAAPIDEEKDPPTSWPLELVRERLLAMRKAVGLDADRQKKYDELRKVIEQSQGAIRRIDTELRRAEGARQRRKALVETRRNTYAEVFSTFAEEQATLAALYKPLSLQLKAAQGALARLEFVVERRVDLASWVAIGERDLLDLRLEGRLRGQGALKTEAEKALLPALMTGAAPEVAAAMDSFRGDFAADLQAAMPRRVAQEEKGHWQQSMAAWLYSTDHVRVEYGIRYDGTAIEQLSPGTRGIVLLLLYLAIDRQDLRPIVVDQPEENLDPKSVFDELVPHFREARRRRQVVIVTHNANLVVNTDADQVIFASSTPSGTGGLPTLSYDSGSLENPRIRKAVCDTLEGGERAFLERELRYRLRWSESLAVD